MARGEMLAAFALSEPGVGSDAKAVTASYVRDGDRYILNGRKKWISYGAIADVLLVAAARNGAMTVFIVDAGQTERTPIKGMLGVRGAHLAEIVLSDVAVSADDVVGPEEAGFYHVVQSALDFGRHSVAWGALGVAQEALEIMVSYARSRKQFDAPIGSFQLVRAMIADAVAETHAARALCRNAADLRRRGELDAQIETSIAKLFSAKTAVRVASDAVQVLGANGCSGSYPAERLYRDAKILEIIEGTHQIQQLMISKYGLRHYRR
jgi:alkylation response protein AidB-like acyl-CoA dehydrogenase